MIYFHSGNIVIRDMILSDGQYFVNEERKQGWDSTIDKFEMRMNDVESGKGIALVAEYCGVPAGYINVYPDSQWGAFANQGYPEIVDFAVLEKYRKNGIGSVLMDAAENIASGYADTVYLGVGLHSGYGRAQRIYVKRGYIPDGSGVWYKDKICAPYDSDCANDDDLVLYLSKKLF